MNESKSKSKQLPVAASVIAILAVIAYVSSLVFTTITYGVLIGMGYILATIALIVVTCVSLFVVCVILTYLCQVFDKEEPAWVKKTIEIME